MVDHGKIWVENALTVTNSTSCAELLNKIREEELSFGASMVSKDEAKKYVLNYMKEIEEVPFCRNCDVQYMAADTGYICPNCQDRL